MTYGPIITTIMCIITIAAILTFFCRDKQAKWAAAAFGLSFSGAYMAGLNGEIQIMTPFLIMAFFLMLKWQSVWGRMIAGIYVFRVVWVGCFYNDLVSEGMFLIVNNEVFLATQAILALLGVWRGGLGLRYFMDNLSDLRPGVHDLTPVERGSWQKR